jgi:transcriptional regulator with XRE-family HTH domain
MSANSPTVLVGWLPLSHLGEYIKQARTKAGLSQRQVGKQSGVNYSTIHDIETNELLPTTRKGFASVEAICRVLSVPPQDGMALLMVDLIGTAGAEAVQVALDYQMAPETVKAAVRRLLRGETD